MGAPLLAALDEAGVLKHSQVPRDRRRAYAKRAGQLSHRRLRVRQAFEDAASDRIGERREGGVQAAGKILNHTVNSLCFAQRCQAAPYTESVKMRCFLGSLVIVLAVSPLGLRAQQEGEQLDADIRMFTVMAAINLAGYDQGYGSPGDSIVRQAVRTKLENFDGDSLELLRNFYPEVKQSNDSLTLSQFVSYALNCEPPPTFALEAELPTDLPPDIRGLRGFGRIVQQFYAEADIESLWQEFQPAYEEEILRYGNVLIPELSEAAGYLRLGLNSVEARGFRIRFDLLGSPNQINTRLYGGRVVIVAHPHDEVPVDEIRRSFLMHTLDRLSIRYSDAVDKKEFLGRFALFAPALGEEYKSDFQLLTTRCLVNAVEARLMRGSEEEKLKRVQDDLEQGWILTPYFFEALAKFEEDPSDIRKYYREMIEAINVKREGQRLKDVQFRTPAPEARRPARAAAPKLSELDKALQRGEFLLREEMTDEAREAFVEAIEKAGGANAQAQYGLARVAITEGDPDLAREHFVHAAEQTEDAHIRAMSHLYLGRIEDIVGNRDQAVEHYKLALEAGDDSPRTRELAEAGLNAPFARPQE